MKSLREVIFLSIVDGGYDLQFSQLLEYREGKGMMLFCQMDVSGRTEIDPAADRLVRNMLGYVENWKPQPSSKALYAGDPAGMSYIQATGFSVEDYTKEALPAHHVLIVGPGGAAKLAADSAAIGKWSEAGGRLLMIGLDERGSQSTGTFQN